MTPVHAAIARAQQYFGDCDHPARPGVVIETLAMRRQPAGRS
jgi:hypothetical protein